MLTFQQLFASTRLLPRTKVNPTSDFRVTQAIGLPFIRAFALQAEFDSYSQLDVAYHEVTIIFHDMFFAETRTDHFNFEVEAVPGVRMYTHRPNFESNKVQVRCTCKDYYFVWWLANNHQGSLAGPPMELYVRLTNPPDDPRDPGYPYRNPNNRQGCCKHLLRLTRYLVEKGLVTYP